MEPEPISATPANLVLLRLPQVKAQTGPSRTKRYRRIAMGTASLAETMGRLLYGA